MWAKLGWRRFGIGFATASEAEAHAPAAETLARYHPAGLDLGGGIPDVDVSTLDAGYVVQNSGPPAVRGVWYPQLNL